MRRREFPTRPGDRERLRTGYYVYNLTGNPWRVSEVIKYGGGFEPSPPGPPHPEVGQVLMPGVDPDHNHIEIEWPPRKGGAQVNYSTGVDGGKIGLYLDVYRDQSHCLVEGGPYVVAGRESTTLRGLAGSDILRGEAGDDRLSGGPGNDALHGGRGSDRVSGGPGSDTIVDSNDRTWVRTGTAGRSRPDTVDVRDRKGDDTVICGSRRTTVIADTGDRVRRCPR
jgi:Ca2+-binding RTX toxin-like protein